MKLPSLLFSAFVLLGRLVIVLLFAAMIAVFCVGVYRRSSQKTPPTPCPAQPRPRPEPDFTPAPIIGYKTAWLAVLENSPMLVVNALGLEHPAAFDWSIDLNQVGDKRQVFVSPSVNGWVQIIGMPDLFDRPGYMEYIAKRFREVQFFITHRVVDYHGWAKYVDGRPVRRYLWCGESGEVLCSDGELTPEERRLGFDRFPQSDALDWDNLCFPNEQDVHRIAAAWGGIDTLSEGERSFQEPGYLCDLPEWAAILR